MLRRPRLTGLCLVGLLFFAWPIPHTTTLRDLLLVAALFLFGYEVWRSRTAFPFVFLRIPLLFYAALTTWLIIVSVFLSPEPVWALSELKSQWLRSLLAMTLGGLAAFTQLKQDPDGRRLIIVILVALLIHIVYLDAAALWTYLTNYLAWDPAIRHPPVDAPNLPTRQPGLTDGPDKVNYLSNMLIALLLAETMVRLLFERRFLPIGRGALALLWAIAFFSIYVSAVRNGVFELALTLTAVVTLFLYQKRRYLTRTVVAAAALVLSIPVGLGYLNYHKVPDWPTLRETVPIALDTETHKGWLSWKKYPLPTLANGQEVHWSNYMRIARFKAGAEMVLERPLGIGYGRNAFAHAVKHKYGEEASSHSHSGLIDLALGGGIPGVVLWIAFLASLVSLGVAGFLRQHSFPALVLAAVTFGFAVRMVVDSTLRDHMLQQYLFLVGIFMVLAAANHLSASQRPGQSLQTYKREERNRDASKRDLTSTKQPSSRRSST